MTKYEWREDFTNDIRDIPPHLPTSKTIPAILAVVVAAIIVVSLSAVIFAMKTPL